MGDPRDAFTLFTTDDEALAEQLAKKLEVANRGRRAAAAAITRGVHAKMAEKISQGAVPSVIALGDPDWKPALLGLVASNIAEEYERPVFLWGREGNQTLKGSCRSYGNIHLVDLMTAAAPAFTEFGGHAYSGGFTVKDDQIFFLEDHLVKARETLSHESVDERMRGDAVLTPDEATFALMKKLARLAPFGEGNPKPVFVFRDVPVTGVSWFGKANEHLKLTLPTEFSDSIEAVAFYAKRELGKTIESLTSGSRHTLLAHLERDQFSRKQVPRLRLVAIS
jgi:single-stranded-DNA-specific exonuclease